MTLRQSIPAGSEWSTTARAAAVIVPRLGDVSRDVMTSVRSVVSVLSWRVRSCASGQYPYPPVEPDEEPPDGAVPPDAGASCHSPPNALTPLPLACPGAVSPTKVYSGCPWKASCVEPLDRLIVEYGALTADVVEGFTGGQDGAHAPVQFDLVDGSGA